MISNGASIVAVSRVAGHKSIAITLSRYAHLVPQDLDNAIARVNHTIEEVLSEKEDDKSILDKRKNRFHVNFNGR